jgi:hypothetical protein
MLSLLTTIANSQQILRFSRCISVCEHFIHRQTWQKMCTPRTRGQPPWLLESATRPHPTHNGVRISHAQVRSKALCVGQPTGVCVCGALCVRERERELALSHSRHNSRPCNYLLFRREKGQTGAAVLLMKTHGSARRTHKLLKEEPSAGGPRG